MSVSKFKMVSAARHSKRWHCAHTALLFLESRGSISRTPLHWDSPWYWIWRNDNKVHPQASFIKYVQWHFIICKTCLSFSVLFTTMEVFGRLVTSTLIRWYGIKPCVFCFENRKAHCPYIIWFIWHCTDLFSVFAVYKKVCIQLSYRTSRFIKRFVHWVNVWNSGSVVKILDCESRNYGFESDWNNILIMFFKCLCSHVYSLHKRWRPVGFPNVLL